MAGFDRGVASGEITVTASFNHPHPCFCGAVCMGPRHHTGASRDHARLAVLDGSGLAHFPKLSSWFSALFAKKSAVAFKLAGSGIRSASGDWVPSFGYIALTGLRKAVV
ncbi:hypothetical protein [Hoeflea sp.]|uniref:hypothetical protein n=1 Tax=Hoeflea sp. TaxID=1940281 RepID=UPI003A912C2F